VTRSIVPVDAGAAAPLAVLHIAAFPAEGWDERALATILALPDCFGRIAIDENEAAGFVLARDLGGECEILTLGVVPERRRRGIGRALLQAALAEARRRGNTSAVLEVAEENQAAQALYRRVGFVHVGNRPNYYRRGGEALVLRADLASTEI
jgi:ribosomal-protein-alanine N-acetyltransferase